MLLERHGAAENLARQVADLQRHQEEKRLEVAWKTIYPGEEDNRRVKASDIPDIARRMMEIVSELLAHFWDFRIFLRTRQPSPNPHYELAIAFLAHACAEDATGLHAALNECSAMLRDIADAHDDLHSILTGESKRRPGNSRFVSRHREARRLFSGTPLPPKVVPAFQQRFSAIGTEVGLAEITNSSEGSTPFVEK